jgi:hypothetical protein
MLKQRIKKHIVKVIYIYMKKEYTRQRLKENFKLKAFVRNINILR